MCLSPGLTKLKKNNRKDVSITLAQSWRISFIIQQQGTIAEGYTNIFKLTGLTDTLLHQRYPALWYHGPSKLVLLGLPCGAQNNDQKEEYNINYPNHIAHNQPTAITIEYSRPHNQIKLYLGQVEIAPSNIYTYPEPNSVCYGKKAVLYLSNNHNTAPLASVENFEYEENLSGRFLGGLTLEQVKSNSCVQD